MNADQTSTTAAELRAAQGLPPKVENPEALAKLAAIFGPAIRRRAEKQAAQHDGDE